MDPFKDVMYRAFNQELEKIALGTAGKLTAGAVLGVGAPRGWEASTPYEAPR